jgi:hypothetical protein
MYSFNIKLGLGLQCLSFRLLSFGERVKNWKVLITEIIHGPSALDMSLTIIYSHLKWSECNFEIFSNTKLIVLKMLYVVLYMELQTKKNIYFVWFARKKKLQSR